MTFIPAHPGYKHLSSHKAIGLDIIGWVFNHDEEEALPVLADGTVGEVGQTRFGHGELRVFAVQMPDGSVCDRIGRFKSEKEWRASYKRRAIAWFNECRKKMGGKTA